MAEVAHAEFVRLSAMAEAQRNLIIVLFECLIKQEVAERSGVAAVIQNVIEQLEQQRPEDRYAGMVVEEVRIYLDKLGHPADVVPFTQN